MLKDKSVRSSLKLPSGSIRNGALRSSIDFLTGDSQNRLAEEHGLLQSLSESCNFVERASLPHQKMFRKSNSRNITLGPCTQNLSPNIGAAEHQCQNHQSKSAQFRVASEGDEMYYCERCAISLASQGFNVCRIDEIANQKKPVPISRPIEVDFLLDHVELIRESIGKKHTQLLKHDHTNRSNMDKLEEELNSHFLQLEQLLQEIKRKSMEEFHQQRNQFIGQQSHSEAVYIEAMKDLDSIAEQIRTELPKVGQLQGKQQMASYRSRLETYRKILGDGAASQSLPLIKYKTAAELSQPLAELLRIQFNMRPKNKLFSFCKSTASSSDGCRQPARAVSQFGSCL